MKKKVKIPESLETGQFLRINRARLDDEWAEQSNLVFKYSKMLAKSIQKENDLAAEVKVVEAELGQRIRNDPGEFGLVRSTDKSVTATVKTLDEYKQAVTNVSQAKYKSDLLRGAISALSHRKKALENLVRLFGMSYFADPRHEDDGPPKKAKTRNKKLAMEDDDEEEEEEDDEE